MTRVSSRFGGKTVVVTGGGSGIGYATAKRFAIDGADVYIIGRSEPRLKDAAEQLAVDGVVVAAFAGDVADSASMTAVATTINDRAGGIDVVVNNAGLSAPSNPVDAPEFADDLAQRLAVDVMGTAVTTTAFLPYLRRGGSVLNMGSVYATTPEHGSGSYSAAKGAIIGLTRTLAVELGARGIRVNCVSPGWVDVAKWEDYFDTATLAHLRGGFDRVPLRAAVTVDEIASVYAFLADDDAAAISGQDIVVDRGMSSDLYVSRTVPGL